MIASSILITNTTSIEGQVARTEEKGGKEIFLVLPSKIFGHLFCFLLTINLDQLAQAILLKQ